MIRPVVISLALVFFALALPLSSRAMDPPHYDPARGYTCASCHTGHLTLGSTGYNNVCLTCHRPGSAAAGTKPFTPADAADPFDTHSTDGLTRRYQTSHRWDGPDTVPAAGAEPPLFSPMTTTNLRGRSGNELACVRCHNQHFNTFPPFLRMANDQDQICLDCHRSRKTVSHLSGSHPVTVDYNAAAAARPTAFKPAPENANPANPTSDLAARLTSSGGRLLCTTCHGVHYSDSRSGTTDGHAGFATLSSGDGYLLRTDRRGGAVAKGVPDRPNLCTNCHAGKKSHNFKGQDIQCDDCHGAHVEYDPQDPAASQGKNVYLVRRYLTRAGGQQARVLFRYTGSRREYKNAQNTGICQGCHPVPPPGGNYPPEHDSSDPKVCNACHFHNSATGSFSGACIACHGYPPTAATMGGPNGLATPATGALGPAPASAGAHATHVTTRAMGCNACHNGYGAKAMPSGTIDIGFSLNGGTIPGFAGSVTGGTFTGSGNLTGYTWSAGAATTVNTAAGAVATCSVYCHGTTLSGAAIGTPSWTGANQAACGACHGVTAATPPASGSHARHAGSGATGLALACDKCHGPHGDNGHVNGGVEWDLTGIAATALYKTPAGAFATSGTTGAAAPSGSFGQCGNIYCHSTVQGNGGSGAPTAYAQPAWGGATLGCGGCHADMKTSAGATGSHDKHAQGLSIGCNVCHGTGYGATMVTYPRHANGFVNISAAGFSYSKGKAFASGSAPYGTCAAISCHGGNSATWGVTLNCQDCHSGAADTDAFALPFTAASPMAVVGTQEWTTRGHGAAAPYASGTPGAGFSGANQCLYCHDAGVAHNAVTNVFRLLNYSSAPFGRNAPCLICHAQTGSSSVLGKSATGKVASSHFGAGHGSSNSGGYFCWDCHDPHGDGNAFMIQDKVARVSDRSSGAPTATAAVGFTSFATGTDYAGGAARLCNACHTTAGHYTATASDGHNSGTRCTACHSHSGPTAGTAFTPIPAGGNCDSCHGYPPVRRNLARGSDFGRQGIYSSARYEDYSGGGGAHTVSRHLAPTVRAADGWAPCAGCHANGSLNPATHTMTMPVKPSRVTIDLQDNRKFDYRRTLGPERYSGRLTDNHDNLSGSCANTSCHFKPSKKWGAEK